MEDLLEYIEKEESEFRNHWLFRELNCTPEELFESATQFACDHHIEIPKAQAQYKIPPKLNPISHINFSRLTVLRA
ncbi:MAG: hypothetical protein ACD_73C00690G0006 [uncultured bacterium]|nr:MAG: hypothetical protein ACD_73C00690G0006 [uncultured bacterium]